MLENVYKKLCAMLCVCVCVYEMCLTMLLKSPILKHSFFIFSYFPQQNTHTLDVRTTMMMKIPSHCIAPGNLAHLLSSTGLDIRGFMVPNMVGRGRLDVHGIDIKFMCNFIGPLCGRYQAGYVSQHHVYKAS